MESFHGGALQIQIQDVFKFYAKSIHSFSLGRCQGWLSKRLDDGSCSDGLLLLHPQLSVQCGDRMERLDRHLTSEGCNTLSMVKISGKARVISIRIQSHIVFLYVIIIVPTFNVTPSNF